MSASAATAGAHGSGELLIVNDELVDMLMLLDYDGRNQFVTSETPPMSSRHYFATPSQNSALQFKYFAQLCAWLFKSRLNIEPTWGKYDDPGTICTSLCVLLKDTCPGLGSDNLVPMKLKPGWGEAVLEVLHGLTKLALERTGFQFQTPIFPEEGLADDALDGPNAQDGTASDIDEDESLITAQNNGHQGGRHGNKDSNNIHEDDYLSNHALVEEHVYKGTIGGIGGSLESGIMKDGGLNTSGNNLLDTSGDLHEGVLESQLDPQQWALELERVVPRLLQAQNNLSMSKDGKEWRDRLVQTKQHQMTIEANYPEGLVGLRKDLASLSERIKQKEQFLNTQFDHRASEFSNTQEELKKVTAQHTQLQESVMNLQIEYKSVVEELDEVKSKMESLSTTVTDTAPIVRIKDAFQKLRLETRQIEVKIGVLSHTLMQAKLRGSGKGGEGDAMET